MPTSLASHSGEKKATSAAQPQTIQPLASGEPTSKVQTQSSADSQSKQHNKYMEAQKFLSTLQVMPKGAPNTPQTVAKALLALVETYKLPDNIAKALTSVSEVISQMDNQCQGCASAKLFPELIKEMQGNISKELKQKLGVLETKLKLSSPSTELLETTSKEISQVARSIKEA